jgi:hypothetical protein
VTRLVRERTIERVSVGSGGKGTAHVLNAHVLAFFKRRREPLAFASDLS